MTPLYPLQVSVNFLFLFYLRLWEGAKMDKVLFLVILFVLESPLKVKSHNCHKGQVIKASYVKASMSLSYVKSHRGEKAYYGRVLGHLRYLEQALNWTLDFIETPDRKWGNRLANGSFDGAIGLLLNNNQVKMVASISMSQERSKVVDFSYPWIIDPLALLSHKPGYLAKWHALTWPFSTNLWIITFLSYFTFSAFFFLFIKSADNLLDDQPKEGYFGFYNCMTIIFRCRDGQGSGLT